MFWFLLFLPFLGTISGALLVYFIRGTLNKHIQHAIEGFGAGVMIAASIWSLLTPCIEYATSQEMNGVVVAVVGFLSGVLFLSCMDIVTSKYFKKASSIRKMVFAITLHNLPEGMAAGVILSLALDTQIVLALPLLLGIAIQNIPEGTIISVPLLAHGMNRHKAGCIGIISGAIEPVAAILTLLLLEYALPILPYMLSFAAGAMMHVVIEELIPSSQETPFLATVSTSIGFLLMMSLDILLG